MKVATLIPDAERAFVAALTAMLNTAGEDVTCSVGVPAAWTPASKPHVEVTWDGTPGRDTDLVARCAIRVTVRAATTTEAKRIARVVYGLAPTHPGGDGIVHIRQSTGPLPARDPDTKAELAAVTFLATVRAAAA